MMHIPPNDLPIESFVSLDALHAWLLQNHATSAGLWVRIGKRKTRFVSITFEELLDEGLCFGWSESTRLPYDDESYLQRFTPRRLRGTTSTRNQERIKQLIAAGRMTPAGLAVLKDEG